MISPPSSLKNGFARHLAYAFLASAKHARTCASGTPAAASNTAHRVMPVAVRLGIKLAAVDRRRHAQELVPAVLLGLGALVDDVERAQYQIPQVRVAARVVDAEGEGPIFLSYDREGGAGPGWAQVCRHRVVRRAGGAGGGRGGAGTPGCAAAMLLCCVCAYDWVA